MFLRLLIDSNTWGYVLIYFFAVFTAQCSAKALLETIPTFPELSQLQSYIEMLPRLSAELTNVDNYTLLAPTNDAFDAWLGTTTPEPTLDDIEATLFYHLIHGIYPVASFTKKPQFASSFLTNTSYTNVTSGQAIELSLSSSQSPLITSGNMTNTSITTTDVVTTGGLMQVVSSVLQIPQREPIVVRDAKLSFFIDLLNKGGFLSSERDEFTTNMTDLPNTIYFAPNTEASVLQFPTDEANSTDRLTELLEYHVVSGEVLYSSDFSDGMHLTTIQGSNLTIRVDQSGVIYVNEAKMLQTNFMVANGVLHTIDSMLDPANITSINIHNATSGLRAPIIVGIIITAVIILGSGSGITFYLLRRKGSRFGIMRLRDPIPISKPISVRTSYSSHSQHPAELSGGNTAELGVWPSGSKGGGTVKNESRGVKMHAVELDASGFRSHTRESRTRGYKVNEDREEKAEGWETYPAHKYRNVVKISSF